MAGTFTGFESYRLNGVRLTEEEFGRGSYAVVLRVEYRGLKCAGKQLYPVFYEQGVGETIRRFEEECRLLAQMRHPNIVQFIGVYFEEGSRVPILVMEFLPTTLAKCIDTYGVFPEEVSYSILYDVALGLYHLHSQTPPIIHRDLSANNVLLASNMTAKISDLGVARILNLTPLQMSRMTSTPGTSAYMPPEAMRANPRYDARIDEFSYGILMIHVLSGRWPLPLREPVCVNPENRAQLLPVSEAERRVEYLRDIGTAHPLMDLILRCVKNDPGQRATAAQMVQRMEHMTRHSPPTFPNRVEMLQRIRADAAEKGSLREENETFAAEYECTPLEKKLSQNQSVQSPRLKPPQIHLKGRGESLASKFQRGVESWECGACYLQNTPVNDKCIACGTNKETSKSDKTVQLLKGSRISLASKFQRGVGSWECGACYLQNTAVNDKCIACGTNKDTSKSDKTVQSLKRSSKSLASNFQSGVGSWECGACYLQNTAKNKKCIACGTNKESAESDETVQSLKGSSESLASNFQPRVGSWECGACYLRNTAGNKKCIACGTNRESAESDETMQSLKGSGESLASNFQPKVALWECGACYLQNTAENKKCIACGANKESSESDNTVQSLSLASEISAFQKSSEVSAFIPSSSAVPRLFHPQQSQPSMPPLLSTSSPTYSPLSTAFAAKITPVCAGVEASHKTPSDSPREAPEKKGDQAEQIAALAAQLQQLQDEMKELKLRLSTHPSRAPPKLPMLSPPAAAVMPLSPRASSKPSPNYPSYRRSGEEDEDMLFSHRAKLFRYEMKSKEWKERGVGDMKVLRHTATGKVRLLMRRDQVLKICCNHRITSELKLTPMAGPASSKSWTWYTSCDFADGVPKPENLAIRFKYPETAQEFKSILDKCIEETHIPEHSPAASPSTDSTSTAVPDTGSLATKFAPPPGGWICKICCIQNNASVLKCAACYNPKPGQVTPPSQSSKGPIFQTGNKSPGFARAGEVMFASPTQREDYNPEAEANVHFKPLVVLPEVAVKAGEEEEEAVFSHRAKLFRFNNKVKQWEERGVGDMKLLRNKSTNKTRVIMRQDQVLKICCNHTITAEMNLMPNTGSDRSWMWYTHCDFADEVAKPEKLTVRFKHAETARQFKEVFDNCVDLAAHPHPQPLQAASMEKDSPVKSGEEDEDTLFSHRAKLFRFEMKAKEWKERGVGDMKVLRHTATGKVRLLMRRDQVLKICCNHRITSELKLTPMAGPASSKSWTWYTSCDFADGVPKPENLAIRFKYPETAQEFKSILDKCIEETHIPEHSPAASPSTDSTSTAVPDAGSLATKFAPPPGGWICEICCIQNNASVLICAACYNPKPGKVTPPSQSSKGPIFQTGNKSQGFARAGEVMFASLTQREDYNPEAEANVHFKPLVVLPEVAVKAGEEEEKAVFSHRAKLFRFDNKINQWRERGVGDMKLLRNKSTNKTRVIMRRDQVLKICCNHTITAEMNLMPNAGSDKSWMWYTHCDFADEVAKPEKLAVRFKHTETARQFKEVFDNCVGLAAHPHPQPLQAASGEKDSPFQETSAQEEEVEERKPLSVIPPDEALVKRFASPAKSWSCSVCHMENEKDFIECRHVCGTPNPLYEASSPKPTAVAIESSLQIPLDLGLPMPTPIAVSESREASEVAFGSSGGIKLSLPHSISPLPSLFQFQSISQGTPSPSSTGSQISSSPSTETQ